MLHKIYQNILHSAYVLYENITILAHKDINKIKN